jgi:hypothetical protein
VRFAHSALRRRQLWDTNMQPTITFKCTNKNCVPYGKDVHIQYPTSFGSLTDASREDYSMARMKRCPKCSVTGEVVIEHGERSFSGFDAFGEYIHGAVKEMKLLKKLVDRYPSPGQSDQLPGAGYETGRVG